jgi:hypothetical protein
MKHCKKCGRVWPLSEFQIRSVEKGTYRNTCKECRRDYDRAYYRKNSDKYKTYRRRNQPRYRYENRQKLHDYLADKKCVDCGESDRVVLELDHVHGPKDYNIGTMVSMYCWARILQEIEKCEVRCANCHRRKTARQFKWFKGGYGT